jgi:hypothetical protein
MGCSPTAFEPSTDQSPANEKLDLGSFTEYALEVLEHPCFLFFNHMKTKLEHLQPGDKAVILSKSYGLASAAECDEFTPLSIANIVRVTPEFIETTLYRFDRSTGMPANQFTQGHRLSVDPNHEEAVLTKQLLKQTEIQRREAAQREQQSRVTFQLASQIVNTVEPERTIEALERLGEDRLRQILEWLKA